MRKRGIYHYIHNSIPPYTYTGTCLWPFWHGHAVWNSGNIHAYSQEGWLTFWKLCHLLLTSIGNYKQVIGMRMLILAWCKIPIYNCIQINISDGTKLAETVAAAETSSVGYTSFFKVNLSQSEQLTCQHPRRANPHPVRGPEHMEGLAWSLHLHNPNVETHNTIL